MTIDEFVSDLRLDIELILSHVLNMNRVNLYAHGDKNISDDEIKIFNECLKRRLNREPLAYIVGHKQFMNLDLIVNENVLIPRPETEILVENVINRLKNFVGEIKIADIGTGSGAIALSIVDFLPNVFVDAVDINEKSLEVAKSNAIKNNLQNKINFYHGDLFNPIQNKKFNAIVSNPPYIPTKIIDELQDEISKYEPRIALDGGIDGLNFYRRLINESQNFLNDEGFLAFEIGYNQAESIKKFAKNIFNCVEVIKDLSNLNRVMILRNDY